MIAVLCLLLGLWLTVAYLDYNPLQEGYMTTDSTGPADKNLVGKIGADVARISFVALGLGAWMVPLFSFWSLWIAVRHSRRLAFGRFTAMTLAIVSACGLAAMIKMDSFAESQFFPDGRLGGVLGFWVYDRLLFDTVGVFGSASLLATIDVVALVIIFTRDIAAQCEKLITSFHDWRAHRRERRAERAEEKRAAKAIAAKLREEEKAAIKAAKLAEKERIAEEKAAKKEAAKAGAAVATKEIKLAGGTEDPLAKAPAKRPAPAPTPEPEPEPAPEPRPKPKVIGLSLGKPNDGSETSPPSGGTSSPLKIVKAEELKKARNADAPKKVGSYEYPPKSLLTEQAKPHEDNSEEEHQRNADNLLRILEEFGVKVSLGEIHVGPVITRYEVIPAPGVRVEKISGLDKNIALGMRAQSVRILAPIPGKAAVGVEVPNQHPTAVGMREILESQDWVSTKAELPIALGKDVSGKPLVSDLAKMPHLLIAGATGSGKSVCINSIVASIVYSKTPDEVRMIMVDPKVVELKVFNTLPHMLIPVVTSPKMVPGALKWLLAEMEQRYQFFAKCNVRNIIGFNNRKKKNVAPDLPDAPPDQADLPGVTPDDEVELPEKLPYIVAIIDELADLMMVAPAEIETSIARLAQLARAAGIHLIIATQRPSVNVITGVIKANLPSRIAFQVASQIDSRTILDTKGADNLIGRGDMLFSPPGTARLVRSQGAFCSDEEVMNIVEFMQAHNGLPIYKQDVQEKIESSEDSKGGGGDDDDGPSDEDDELYNRALGVLKSTKRASTSMIQRRLRIGYNRAARIMDMLEDRDIVGPENGSSPREILVDLDSL
ncbi:FtsK/SpoIIIE family DNA translocase [Synoicihabitans lomoniglobus]|uniref:DNA translocase FtsK 4TM domain-containing protein n=1 Tax=Synoicihabitans lomoniglobus TaxID=2909285 RepID=A0AAE9ZV73_9BACT|nr:DNA translocase FtsK [Opitutaceae bacterium LMO-M01]WED63986.1 DNA translocase FtsK 4TM domain-containing protein [Opitutaceae bacterium LMO-M01]